MSRSRFTPEAMKSIGVPDEHAQRAADDVNETVSRIEAMPDVTGRQAVERHRAAPVLQAARVTGWILPDRKGEWRIEQFQVTAEDEVRERLRSMLSSSSRGRWTPAGTYTQLCRVKAIVMSDTPDELMDLLPLVRAVKRLKARRVVVNGLGLGCAVRLLLSLDVEHVDVVELAPEVIEMVGPYFPERVTIHQGDAYTFKFPAGTRWDVAWHDIWDDISIENDFATLHRRYGGRVFWQASWGREVAQRSHRLWEKENSWWTGR